MADRSASRPNGVSGVCGRGLCRALAWHVTADLAPVDSHQRGAARHAADHPDRLSDRLGPSVRILTRSPGPRAADHLPGPQPSSGTTTACPACTTAFNARANWLHVKGT